MHYYYKRGLHLIKENSLWVVKWEMLCIWYRMIYNKNYIRSCCTHLNLFLIYVALYLTIFRIRITYPTFDHILDYACCETKIIYYCSYSPLCLSALRLPFFRFPQTIAVVVLVRSSLHDITKKEGTKLSLPCLIF